MDEILEKSRSDPRNEDLMVLYQDLRSNQQFYMSQQWRVSYYAVLLYGALFYVFTVIAKSKLIQNDICYIKIVVMVIGFILCFFSCMILRFLESSLTDMRRSIRRIERRKPIIQKIVFVRSPKNKKRPVVTSIVGCILTGANVSVYLIFCVLIFFYSA